MRTLVSRIAAVITISTLAAPAAAFAQSPGTSNARPIMSSLERMLASPAEPRGASAPPRSASSRRVVWTGIGAGLGFGAGMLVGLQFFDDAVYAERKILTTAAAGAVIGGTLGALLSREDKPRPDGTPRPRKRAGLITGAVVGAAVGMVVLPATQCDTKVNPECPIVLATVAGVPMVAAGAAIGALVDKLR